MHFLISLGTLICLLNLHKTNANTLFINKGPVILAESHAHLYMNLSFKKLSQSKLQLKKITDAVSEYLSWVNITDYKIHNTIDETSDMLNKLDEKFNDIKRLLKLRFTEDTDDSRFLLKEVLKMPANPITSNNIPSRKRNKRQIAFGVAAAFAIGIYNFYDTQILKESIDNDSENQNDVNKEILLVLDEYKHKINDINDTIMTFQNKVKNFVLKIVKDENSIDNAIEMIQLLRTQSVQLHFEYENILHAMFDLTQGKLSVDLFNLQILEQSFKKLLIKIKEMNFEPINNHFSSIFNCKYSYEGDNEGIHLFIHVPIAPKDNKLFLYQYINLPLFKNNMNIRIQGKSNFLITDESLDHGLELSQGEMQSCQLGKNPIFCPLHYLRRDVRHSCLGLLFTQNFHKAMNVCNLFVSSSQKTEVVHLKKDNFAISASKNKTFTLTCAGLQPKILNFSQPQIITINPSCKLTGSEIMIQEPKRGPIIDTTNILMYPPIPEEIMFAPIIPHEKEIKELLPKTKKHTKPISLEKLKKTIYKKITDDKEIQTNNYKMLAIGALFIIMVIIVTMIMIRLIAVWYNNN